MQMFEFQLYFHKFVTQGPVDNKLYVLFLAMVRLSEGANPLPESKPTQFTLSVRLQ